MPLEPLDNIVDLMSATILTMIVVYTAINFSDLSDTIPTHYNASGEPDGFGNKMYIWLLPAIGIITFIVLFVLNKFPHLHNYKFNITQDNALKNYRFMTRVFGFTALFITILFVFIQYLMIEQGKGNATGFSAWFTPLIIVIRIVFAISIAVYQQIMTPITIYLYLLLGLSIVHCTSRQLGIISSEILTHNNNISLPGILTSNTPNYPLYKG